MTHLCLGISASDLQIPGRHEEALLLLRGGLLKQGGQEHAQVKIQRLRLPSVHKTSEKYQGRAWERSITRCEKISNLRRQSKGKEKKTCKYEVFMCTLSWMEHCPFLYYFITLCISSLTWCEETRVSC